MDYCLTIEKYQRAGYTIQEVNDAIELCGRESPASPRVNDYLLAYSRVKDVGFDRDRVKKALRETMGGVQGNVDKWSQDAVALLLNYN